MRKKILIIVTNIECYENVDKKTGLWLGELTHFYDKLQEKDYQQDVVSISGGAVPIDPRSLKGFAMDSSIKKRMRDPAFMALLQCTKSIEEVNASDYNAIFLTGGHGVMWDFPDSSKLQELIRDIYEQGGIVSSVCHGYCGLLNVKLSDGQYLVKNKKVTGYSWTEEKLAGVADIVPYNAEIIMKERGAHYNKGLVPLMSYTTRDGRLITGQNPFSTKATAEVVIKALIQYNL